MHDIFKFRVLKFLHKLTSGLLPPFLIDIVMLLKKKTPSVLRQHVIHQPMVKSVHVECAPLFVLYCIVLYCIMRPYTDGPIGPLSYRHSSGVVRNPHSTLAK